MTREFRLIFLTEELQKKIFLWISCGVVFTIPFKTNVNSFFCILLFVFWGAFMTKHLEKINLKKIMAFSTLFWIALVAMIYTTNVTEGLFRMEQKLLLIIIPIVYGTIKIDWKQEARWIITMFLVGVVMACLYCLINATWIWLRTGHMNYFFSQELSEPIDLYTYILALVCLLSIIVLIEAYLNNLELKTIFQNKKWQTLLIVFFTLFIFLLSVKQMIICWVIVVIYYVFRIIKHKIWAFSSLLILLVIMTALIVYIPTLKYKMNEALYGEGNTLPPDGDFSKKKDWNGIVIRKAIWTCSLDVIHNNLFLGTGTGDAQDELQKSYEKRKFYFASQFNRYNTHNQYLQLLVTYGIIGFFIWFSSLIWLFKKHQLNTVFTLSLICFAVSMLTESMLETNKGILSMSSILSIFSFSSVEKIRGN